MRYLDPHERKVAKVKRLSSTILEREEEDREGREERWRMEIGGLTLIKINIDKKMKLTLINLFEI